MNYREEVAVSKKNKEEYLSSLNELISKKQKDAFAVRKEYTKDIIANGEKYREDFKKMLGWPLVDETDNRIELVSSEKLSDEDGYSVWRMQFEILGGLKVSGLFFKQESNEAKPLVIVQHGGEGTPELISGVYGDSANYNDMLQRVIKYGVHAFAPQLLLWEQAKYEICFDRKNIDGQLKSVGGSITAIEVFAIQRILDYFEKESYVSNFGMLGLSYGGFYTLFTTAVEKRIKSAVSCSFFNKRDSVGWSDWEWQNSAIKFDDAEIACLVYPRKLCIRMGDKDELFDYKYSQESFERLKELCSEVGTNWVEFAVFDGTHEFFRNDEPIEKLVNDIK
ncbi:MAG: hypothetical protein UIM24_03850 [Clostridia bacterium]|nr:hypothetical protein [Clostridia bacterium]